jgi:hypothetical protein
MSFTFYLFDRDAWDDPNEMLRDNNNTGRADAGDQITLTNPGAGQVVTVNNNATADGSSVAGGTAEQYTISGVTFPAGTSIEMDYGFVLRDANGIEYFVGKVKVSGTTDSRYNGSIMTQGWDPIAQEWVGPPAIGTTFTLVEIDDATQPGPINPWQRDGGGVREGSGRFNPYSNDVRLGEGVDAPVIDNGFFPICFVAGTMIATDKGLVAVEMLRPGDLVMTRDAGLQPLVWVGIRRLGKADLAARENWRPVRIGAGALGDHLPERDVLVSPQHRVLVRSPIADRMVDSAEVLVPAKDLTTLPAIDRADDVKRVTYVHLLFETHQIVFAEGAEMESLFVGPMTLANLDTEARQEVLALFPEILTRDAAPARALLRGRKARHLAQRHQVNAKPLVSKAKRPDPQNRLRRNAAN